jgi:hypothetical protein
MLLLLLLLLLLLQLLLSSLLLLPILPPLLPMQLHQHARPLSTSLPSDASRTTPLNVTIYLLIDLHLS